MTASALPASRDNRALIASPAMIGPWARRLLVRGAVCLLLGALLSIAIVAAAHLWLHRHQHILLNLPDVLIAERTGVLQSVAQCPVESDVLLPI